MAIQTLNTVETQQVAGALGLALDLGAAGAVGVQLNLNGLVNETLGNTVGNLLIGLKNTGTNGGSGLNGLLNGLLGGLLGGGQITLADGLLALLQVAVAELALRLLQAGIAGQALLECIELAFRLAHLALGQALLQLLERLHIGVDRQVGFRIVIGVSAGSTQQAGQCDRKKVKARRLHERANL